MKTTRPSAPIAALALSALLSLSCVPDDETAGGREDPPPAGAVKVPFEARQLPDRIDVPRPLPPALATNGIAGREIEPPELHRWVLDAAPGAAIRRGFDLPGFEPPAGLEIDGVEVAREGVATLTLGDGEETTHVARVRRHDSVARARVALTEELAGYPVALLPYPTGDVGAALRRGRTVSRVLFTRGALSIEARALGDGSAVELARALDEHARTAPAAGVDRETAPVQIEIPGPRRAGTPLRVHLSTEPGRFVAAHFEVDGDAWVTTQDGQPWLLAPSAGEREIRAVLIDRWLRRTTTRLSIVITP